MKDETRIVSVLFVDLVASTALSVRLGDDATDRMRRRYFATLREAITLHRGLEMSSAGDGMVAAFEGSAVDAVGCAVAIQRGVAALNLRDPTVELSVRVGVSIGEVASDGEQWQGMPLIEAARLEGAARPDQILVSDVVRSLVGSRGSFRFVSVGALDLKGLAEPLPSSEVDWEAPPGMPAIPLPGALDTSDGPTLVGRADDLLRLRALWRDVVDGAARGVVLAGEAGIGKTRLAGAFAASLRADDVIVLYGRCGGDERWEPFAQALHWYVAAASSEEVREAIGPYGSALSTVVPLLRRHRAELATEGGASDAEVPVAVEAFLANVSTAAPVVLVIDALDEADTETLRLLDHVLSTPSLSRVLVLCLATEPISLVKTVPSVIELAGLSLDDVRLLVDELCDDDESDTGDRALEIHTRAGGNPGRTIALVGAIDEPVSTSSPGPGPAAGEGPSTDMTMIGREEPRHRIHEAVTASSLGRNVALLVSGEAGIGKTTLVRAALESSANDALVGWGTCWHGEGAPAFWPWTQALDDLSRSVGADRAIEAAGNDRDALSVLIRDLGPAMDFHGDPERHRLFLLDAAVRWLETLAVDDHVIVVLDDLQWADSSTLDLLAHLIARPMRARLLAVGSYRHDELEGQQRARLASLVSHAEHIHIDGLSVAEVEELVASICGPATAAQLAPELHRRTGGHPLFVSELARLPDVGTSSALPSVVTEAVARRLRTLPDDTRAVLDAGSALGNRLFADVLAEVTDRRPPEIVMALEAATDAGIVRVESATALWFAHDLFRETLYAELSSTERIALHSRIGAALEARIARGVNVAPADVARHLILAVSVDEPDRAIRWANEAAAEERRRSAFTEAAAHLGRLRTAIADAGWLLDGDVMLQILLAEADDLARSGSPDDARALLGQAAAAAATPESQADVALAVQRLGAKFAARRDDLIAQLESALEAVSGRDRIREARLTAALARELQHSVAEDRLRAGPLSERALDLGRDSEDDETLVACLLARHDALWTPGTGSERAELAHEIADVAARLGSIDRMAEGLVLEANGLLESGSPGFRPVLDRWFGLLIERDEPHDRYMVATRRAFIALLEDRRHDATALMHEAAEIGEQIHEPDTGNVLMSQRVAFSRGSDDPDELRILAADAVAHWTGAPVLAHAVAAGALAAAGDLDVAAREVATVADAGGWRSEGSYLRSVLVGHLADAATALDDRELCYALYDEIEPLVGSCGVNGAVVAFAGPFAHPAGILAAALGEKDRALKLLDQSITIARRLGAKVWVRRGERALEAADAA